MFTKFLQISQKNVLKSRIINQLSTIQQNDFRTVYKFPYIRGIGLINRLKYYQTVLSVTTIPAVATLSYLNVIPYDNLLFTSIIGLSGLIPLYGFGYFSNKLVGIIYLNDKNNTAKLAYLDFWGRRKDVEIPVSDIVPFAEMTPTFTDKLTDPLYLKIRQFSSKNTLKLCVRYGVLDPVGFNKIFSSYLICFNTKIVQITKY